MLYWAFVEQARHEHMPDEYKKRYIIVFFCLRKIRTHLDLLSIPRLWRKNVKTFRWDQRLQIQNLFLAFKQVPRCR